MHSLTYAQAINEALKEEMRRDANLVVLGEDVGKYGGVFGVTRGLYDEFGEARVRDCPLNEAAIISFGIGLALAGKPAVAELEFMDFVTFCMDAITNQAPKLRFFWGGQVEVPLVIRTPIASGLGFGTQHSQSLEGWFMHVPGLKVAMPATAYDAKGLMKTAIRDRNPVLFADNISLYSTKGDIPDEDYTIPFGQARIAREGKDATVVALATMVGKTLEACNRLEKDGFSIEVIDPRTIAPLDTDTVLASVHKTGRLLIVDETFQPCGVGAEIAAQVTDKGFDDLDAPIRRLNGVHTPTPYSPPLEAAIVPNVNTIEQALRDLLAE